MSAANSLAAMHRRAVFAAALPPRFVQQATHADRSESLRTPASPGRPEKTPSGNPRQVFVTATLKY